MKQQLTLFLCFLFIPLTLSAMPNDKDIYEKAVFGGGCFWGIEAFYREMPGVVATRVGYAGGDLANPSYKEVCADITGHAEVVEVTYDPVQISYEQLLEKFWNIHDPTTLNRQGPDVGSQYRSVIYTNSKAQHEAALASKEALETSKRFAKPITTEIKKAPPFYEAEDYHQQYLEKRGLANCHIGLQ